VAGRVKVDLAVLASPTNIHALVARECPFTGRYGMQCVTLDTRHGMQVLCPYLWYVAVVSGGVLWQLRAPALIAEWMATAEEDTSRQYATLCMLADNRDMVPGARL